MRRLSKKMKTTWISMTIVATKMLFQVSRSVIPAVLIRTASELTSWRTAKVKPSANLRSISSSPKFRTRAAKNATTNTPSSTSSGTAPCRRPT